MRQVTTKNEIKIIYITLRLFLQKFNLTSGFARSKRNDGVVLKLITATAKYIVMVYFWSKAKISADPETPQKSGWCEAKRKI